MLSSTSDNLGAYSIPSETGLLIPSVYVIQSSERTMERMKFDGPSENNRRARFYRLTRAGRKLLETEKHDWEQTAAIIARFFEVKAEVLA